MRCAEMTGHAQMRMAQRAIRYEDIDLILRIGMEVESGFFVREKDAQAEIRRLKKEIEQMKRISGKRIVLEENLIKTVYHAGLRKEQSLIRNAEERTASR